jgi:hypothetical protein
MSFPNQACQFEHDYLGIKKIINFALALVTYIGMKLMKKNYLHKIVLVYFGLSFVEDMLEKGQNVE